MHILIAEDNQDHAELLIETLSELCPQVCVTHKSNGEEAISFLHGLALQNVALPNMVLWDIKMPRMSGHEVLTYIKQHDEFKNIPVAMLSTSTHPREVEACLRQGAVSYIAKPLAEHDLENKILSHLR